MRRANAFYLIPSQERGSSEVAKPPTAYEYFFTESERQKMLKDPKCNKEVFNGVAQEKDDIRQFQGNERWYISEQDLQASGLGHWVPSANGAE